MVLPIPASVLANLPGSEPPTRADHSADDGSILLRIRVGRRRAPPGRVSILLCNRPFHYSGSLSSNTIVKWLSAATQSLIGRLQRFDILSTARNSTFFTDSGVGNAPVEGG